MLDFENDDSKKKKKKKIMSGWSFLAQKIINFFDQSIFRKHYSVHCLSDRKCIYRSTLQIPPVVVTISLVLSHFKNVSITDPVNTVNW